MQRLYKRGDTYWIAFKTREGERWIWHRKSTGQRDRRAAERIAGELERSAADPTRATAHKTTLRAALERVVADRAGRGRARGTLTMYASKAGQIMRVMGETTPLDLIGAREVDSYIETRQAEGAARTTIHKELVTLRIGLKLARRRGEYPRSIEEVIPEWSGESTPGTRHIRSFADLRKLLDALPAVRAAHVAYLVATASDWEPSLSACRADIDLEGGTVRVHGTKTASRERTLPIVAFMGELLDFTLDHAGSCAHEEIPQNSEDPPPEVRHLPGVSPDLSHAPAHRYLFAPWGNVRRDLAIACKRAGIEPITPRDLRRTHATWLRSSGVEPHLIGAMLGHTDGRMVERTYGRLQPGALGELLRARLCEDSVPKPGGLPATSENNEDRNAADTVPRGGIEPSTRGFSVHPRGPKTATLSENQKPLRRVV